MKIVYLAYSIIPSRSANSVHVMKMCQALADNGHDVLLLTPGKKETYEENIENVFDYYGVKNNFKIKKLFFSNVSLYKVFSIAHMVCQLLREKPDLVLGRDLRGCSVSALLNFNTAYETHAPFSELPVKAKNVFVKMVRRKCFRGVIMISEALKRMYDQEFKHHKLNVIVAHDGADRVVDLEKKMKLFGRNVGLNIGYIGHLYKGRGIDLIIDVAKRLPNHDFHIVGGTEEDINYWKNTLIKSCINNVFFYGFKAPSGTSAYRNSFDILLAPYAKEVQVQGNIGNTSGYMSPLKVFEYMSHKKAIISSDLPVLREVLSEDNAVLAMPEDVNSWVRAVQSLEDEKVRNTIAVNAHRQFLNGYTWQKRASYIVEKLNEK